ncbi:S41A family C-terminal processing peptidase-1 [Idiomarina loihiensis]|uniref:carboxy terminal-processing peptidase n=1 Tax=Idiomarina TaxID=135575 RepID=UPI000D714C31|nr:MULTISPECIES: carboxy terminal-processing peptidase [Idiomarina]PWW39159.1 S41A family C-terminal processing peptidase-1 [Idiomarina loihiensis]TDP49746.1 S41A family C-terminal processing peptidase-1 [Idiomarina loihiensis]TDS23940.1 S41A family C-terminal processing peptidase-1 [Idiomarina sp. H2]
MKHWAVKKCALALMCVVPAAVAIPPEHKISELPELEQEAQHDTASERITSYFTRYHFSSLTLDNELSEQIHERYFDLLDYSKMFLLKEDVEAAQEYRHLFDDMLKRGELDVAYDIYQKSLERRFQRYEYALSLLDEDKPIDFSVEGDKYYYDREDAEWAESKDELNDLWQSRVKYDALNLKLAGKEWPEIVETLGKRYNSALNRLTKSKSEDVFQTVMNAFARSVEPHTSYLSPSNSERFQQNMNLELEGIGAVLQSEYDYTIIRSLVPGGPADKTDELSPEDKIIAVGQGTGEDEEEFVDVIGMRLDDVVELIKGPKGTTVRLQVLKASQGAGGTPSEVEIVRDKVKLEDRAAKAEVKEFEEGPYKGRRLGVIEIPGFYNNLTADVKKLIEDLQSDEVEGLVVDLRGNGGGALTEAINLSGLFIDKGPVVQVSDGRGRIDVSEDKDGKTYYDGPLFVMVDRYSASASEIFAAAMQDYERALIIGENTFGKGTVQQHRGLTRRFDFYDKPLGSVQYTIAKFYRIDGGSTQLRGVQPDVVFPSFVEASDWGESKEDNALPWDKIDKASYSPVDEINSAEVKELQQQLNQRIEDDPEFSYIFEEIERYREEKDKTWVSLVLTEREKKQEQQKAKQLERVNERLKRAGKEPIENVEDAPDEFTEVDPFLDQAALVAFDFIDKNQLASN